MTSLCFVKSRNFLALLGLKITGQILAFFMLGVMLFIAARFAVLRSVVKIQKRQFRQTAMMQKKDELKQIAFSAEELYKDGKGIEWKENNKEIVVNGTYHEVVSIEKKEDLYIVNIIEDSKENELFKNFFDKTDKKGQLADCITLVLGMNFVTPEPMEFKQQAASPVNHKTQYLRQESPGHAFRMAKPPCA